MVRDTYNLLVKKPSDWVSTHARQGNMPAGPLMVSIAVVIGILAGCGAAIFTWLIETISHFTILAATTASATSYWGILAIIISPAAGLLAVAWFTRRFAPEAAGLGVPKVITAVTRHDGVIRPMVAVVKILASAICIGTGGSIGREGPIVQIGSTIGSVLGRWFKLTPQNVKVLVGAGAAAGISATFNAPIAGVIFANEIILGTFSVKSLAPVVIASVLGDVVQQHIGEHHFQPAFLQLNYEFGGTWEHLPAYLTLGLLAGIAAVLFTKMLHKTDDLVNQWLPVWWSRAIIVGLIIGSLGAFYNIPSPRKSPQVVLQERNGKTELPPLLGVGYPVVEHSLQLERHQIKEGLQPETIYQKGTEVQSKSVWVTTENIWAEFWWILPIIFLKPLMTSMTLAGGGSGGIFAPSLYLGATVGAAFGLFINALFPEYGGDPGLFAIVGMGAVVAGTTHGTLSAILIVYEMTGDYQIILPIMVAAAISSVVAQSIDPDSIYYKSLSRQGEKISRGHDLHALDHVMVRDVMIRNFPIVKHIDTLKEIVRVARANPKMEALPVMGPDGHLLGIIRSNDLIRILDSDVSPTLINAADLTITSPLTVSPKENLLEALSDFGSQDVETLPVEDHTGKLVGILTRADVISRYRQELLAAH